MQPFVGQIIMFGGNFAPSGWVTCSGQLMPISENETLFQLIGTTYGGDGQSTFGIPNLAGRIPIHQGQGGGLSNYVIGQSAGSESVTLNTNQIPQHNHQALSVTGAPGNALNPANNTILANQFSNAPGGGNAFAYLAPGGTQVQLPNSTVASSGGNQPHNNVQPVLTVTICISLFGVFPTQ